MSRTFTFLIAALATLVVRSAATSAQTPSAEDIMRRSNLARYYPGGDMRARVVMRLLSPGGERVREMTMSRVNVGSTGDQRYFIYFNRPPDVRDMVLLVWKYPNRDSDRWLFIPTLKAVRRIAASDKHTSFVGSDFTYEDVSGREPDDDRHQLIREDSVAGRASYVVESIPKDPGSAEFSRKLSWVDKATWLVVKEEYYDARKDLARVFTAEELKQVEGIWTATRRRMKNAQSGHETEVVFSEIQYDRKLSPDLFGERSLRSPPAELVR
jgi:outer membrane lipoprotein-sorting protein